MLDSEGTVAVAHIHDEGEGIGAVPVVMGHVAVVAIGGGGLVLHPRTVYVLLNDGPYVIIKAVHADSHVVVCPRQGKLCHLALGLDLRHVGIGQKSTRLDVGLDGIQAGIVAHVQHVGNILFGGKLGAPGNQDHVDVDGISRLQGHLAQVEGQGDIILVATVGLGENHVARKYLAAQGKRVILDHSRQVDVFSGGGVRQGHEGRLLAKGVVPDLVGPAGRGNHGLVVLVQVAEGLVGHIVAVHGEEGEVFSEILEGDVLQHRHTDLVVGAVLVGLGHFHVTVINGDTPVIGKVTHPYVSVHGTVGQDLVHSLLRGVIVPLRVGVLQEVKAAARVVLGLRLPQRSRHTAEIGKEPAVLVVYVEGGNAVGLGDTGRQVVVGTAELDS